MFGEVGRDRAEFDPPSAVRRAVKGVARTLRSALPIFFEVASLSVPKQHFSYNIIAKLVLPTSKA